MSYPIGRFCTAAVLCVTAYTPQVQALQLVWQAPPECPAAEVVLRETRRLAGANQGEALEARAVVTQTTDQRWRVVIDLSGSATGHRTLTADNCPQLARASSLIIALAANPDAALDLPGDEPALATRQVPSDSHVVTPVPGVPSGSSTAQSMRAPSAPTPPVPEADATTAAARKPLTLVPIELLGRGGLESGSLPTSTGLLGLGARVRLAADSFSLALTTHVTQGTSATFTNGPGASFRVVATQARACIESSANRFHLAACGGMQLAMVRARGYIRGSDLAAYGYTDAETFTLYRWIPGLLLGLNPRYEFARRFTAELGADLIIPTTHWQFVIENMAPLFRPDDLQYLLYLGMSYQLN